MTTRTLPARYALASPAGLRTAYVADSAVRLPRNGRSAWTVVLDPADARTFPTPEAARHWAAGLRAGPVGFAPAELPTRAGLLAGWGKGGRP